MKPIKAKTLLEETAQAVDLPKETVECIIGYYWQEIRNNMGNLTHPRIHVTNLGDFVVKHWKLDDKIEMLEKFEQNNQQKGLQLINARFQAAEKLYIIRGVKKMIEQENQRAEFIRMHKKNIEHVKTEHHTNLESQKPNS